MKFWFYVAAGYLPIALFVPKQSSPLNSNLADSRSPDAGLIYRHRLEGHLTGLRGLDNVKEIDEA